MAAPKGHPPYPGSERGGYFGRHEETYTDEELKELGEGLVKWIQEENNIYRKYFFSTKGILWSRVYKLGKRCPMFQEYLDMAKEIQESKLVSEPYNKEKNKDGAQARFILARHHKGEWEDKNIIVANEEQEEELEKTLSMVDYLQSKIKKAKFLRELKESEYYQSEQ